MSLQCSRFSFIDPADIEAIIASEKEVWNREKLSLQKALKRAEAKVYKLKAELRNDALLRNLGPDTDHAALQVGGVLHACGSLLLTLTEQTTER
jgi:A-kinase anchor protein 9